MVDASIREKIKEYKRLLDEGKRASGSAVTEVYNEVFAPRKLAPTNCSTCIKRRISELYKWLVSEEKKEDERKDNGRPPEEAQ